MSPADLSGVASSQFWQDAVGLADQHHPAATHADAAGDHVGALRADLRHRHDVCQVVGHHHEEAVDLAAGWRREQRVGESDVALADDDDIMVNNEDDDSYLRRTEGADGGSSSFAQQDNINNPADGLYADDDFDDDDDPFDDDYDIEDYEGLDFDENWN